MVTAKKELEKAKKSKLIIDYHLAAGRRPAAFDEPRKELYGAQ